jgi:hypothetical protein
MVMLLLPGAITFAASHHLPCVRRSHAQSERVDSPFGRYRRRGKQYRRETSREERTMCANCGCGIPEDKHGDDRNIAWSEIVAAADANDASPTEAIRNMQKMAEQQG